MQFEYIQVKQYSASNYTHNKLKTLTENKEAVEPKLRPDDLSNKPQKNLRKPLQKTDSGRKSNQSLLRYLF